MRLVIIAFAILLFESLANGSISDAYNEKASNYCGLINCEYFSTDDSYYREYIPIENLTNIQPQDGYILRFPLFIIGSKNAHIIFTDTKSPDWDRDNGYEFVFGGWQNSRIAIRNRKDFKEFAFSDIYGILSADKPTKFLFEITDTGYIRVYLNSNTEPLMATFDPKLLQVKYVSFRSDENTVIEYFYNCPSLKDENKSPPTIDPPPSVDGDLSNFPLNVLGKQCQWHDAWNGDLLTPFNVTSFVQHEPETNKTRLDVYIVLVSHARIVLSPQEGLTDGSYDFTINDKLKAELVQRKGYYSSESLGSFTLPRYPSDAKPVKITFEFSAGGLVDVFVGSGSYKPMLSATTNSSVNINYIALSTGPHTRTLYYFGCPIKKVTTVQYDILPADDFSEYGSLKQNCTQFNTEDHIFTEYIQLSSFATNVQPDGFLIRLPFYVQAYSNVHILVTSGFNNNKQFYEFVIDGSEYSYDSYGTFTSVSKNKDILENVPERDILLYNRPVRIVLEITNDGKIRIFTQHNKSKPLLEVQDSNPITNLKYVGFGGTNRNNEFYYDCSKFKPVEEESVTEKAAEKISSDEVSTGRQSTGSSTTPVASVE